MDGRGHRRAGVLIGAALVAATAAGPAVATAQDAERAREMFRLGVERMEQDRFQEAAEAFRASYDAAPRVATMCNLALAYDRWGAYPEVAVESYERCAEEDASGRYRSHAEERARELREELASAPAPDTPPPDLPPDPFAGPAAPGTDGPPAGPAAGPPATGPEPPPPEDRSHGLLWAGLGAGAVAVGSLVGAALLASSASDDEAFLHDEYPDADGDGVYQIPRGSDGERVLEDAETKAGWSVALYVVSGAAAALAATLVVLDLTGPGEPQAQVGVAATPDGALVSARASF